MAERVAVITGATSGIGRGAAAAIARQFGTVVLVGRSPARGQETVAEIQAASGNRQVLALTADLADPAQIVRLADELGQRFARIDLLVNNAGGIFTRRQENAHGHELTFALNHLSYFLLSARLLEPLRRAAPSRVVMTASEAHRRASLDFTDLMLRQGYGGWPAYQKSKLANILFTRAFARRHRGEGIIAACYHPGFVATRIGDENRGWFGPALWLAKQVIAEPVSAGAERLAFLATTPEIEPGGYYSRNQLTAPSAAAQSEQDAERLWVASEKLLADWLP